MHVTKISPIIQKVSSKIGSQFTFNGRSVALRRTSSVPEIVTSTRPVVFNLFSTITP